MKTVEERFWEKVDKNGENGCWEWKAALNSYGYGNFKANKKNVSSHRFSYELLKGDIPKGKHLDHLCRNRKCCNPKHLEPVTQRENLLRGETIPASYVLKTHCPQGHEYTEENTYTYKGSRYCITCRNKYSNRSYYSKKEKVRA
jgi:hypothetical protein